MKAALKNEGEKDLDAHVLPCVYPYVNALLMAPWDKPEWYTKTEYKQGEHSLFQTTRYSVNGKKEECRYFTCVCDEVFSDFELSAERLVAQTQNFSCIPEAFSGETERVLYAFEQCFAAVKTWRLGAEPYGDYFKNMGLDAVVGSVGGGVTVRMLSEIPHVKYHEGRFLPYFFPDTFFEGNEENAVAELNRNWLTARRAHMRKPLDRMGFGGYLSLAAKFPSFIDRVEEIADEFRTVYDAIDNKKPYCRLKVGLLNAWGKKRSWMSRMVAHELWYQSIYSYQGILEAVSGLPVDIEFLSFEDVMDGVPANIDVLINAGDAYTAFSGGEAWLDEKLQVAIRSFVYNGGGFIGVGEPTACSANGRYFQLADVLGVDEEIGYTLSNDKYNIEKVSHELTDGMTVIDYGEDKKNIYALDGAKVLDIVFSERFKRNVNVGEVKMAVNEYGKGKSFYITGIPYSFENARLLYKAMCYVCGKDLHISYLSNPLTECNYYPTSGKYAIVNNSGAVQTTDFYDINGKKTTLTLRPMEIKWIQE